MTPLQADNSTNKGKQARVNNRLEKTLFLCDSILLLLNDE
jgi:hypothetical protein